MQENSEQLINCSEQVQRINKLNNIEQQPMIQNDQNQIVQNSQQGLTHQNFQKPLNNGMDLEKEQIQGVSQKKDEIYNQLKESLKEKQFELQYFQQVLFQSALTQQQKQEIIESQNNYYQDAIKSHLSLNIQVENLTKENLILKNEKQLLEKKLQCSQKQCQDIQEIYQEHLLQFKQQLESMYKTINIMKNQVDENKYFKEFMEQQIQLNQDIQQTIEDTSFEIKNSKQDELNFKENKMIIEQDFDLSQYNNILEENLKLSMQIHDYESNIAPMILEKENEIKNLQEDLKALNKSYEEMRRENIINFKELQTIKYKKHQIQKITNKDIELLLQEYFDEKSLRESTQQELKMIQDEMNKKSPQIKKQNEKWIKLNKDFLKFEQEYTALQKDLNEKQKNIDELQDQIDSVQIENKKLQLQTQLLKEEVNGNTNQISHLLKINEKLKQNVSQKLGKNHLDEVIQEIQSDKAQQFGIQDVDSLYKTNYSIIYSDIKELIDLNKDLSKKIRIQC